MGLRAFTSQLLCEQVVGRGLRRTAYELDPETGLFEPEYVNIFGVPFTFLPHEGGDGPPPPPPTPKTRDRAGARARRSSRSRGRTSSGSTTCTGRGSTLDLDAGAAARAQRGRDGAARRAGADRRGQARRRRASTEIDLEELGAASSGCRRSSSRRRATSSTRCSRTGRAARRCCWPSSCGSSSSSCARTGSRSRPALFDRTTCKRRLILTLNMNRIVQHICGRDPLREHRDAGAGVRPRAADPLHRRHAALVHRQALRARRSARTSTSASTTAPGRPARPSSSTTTRRRGLGEERPPGFEILYVFHGVVRKYRPDFLIRLATGKMLVLEVKGQDPRRTRPSGRPGRVDARGERARRLRPLAWAVSRSPSDIVDLVRAAAQ